MSLETTCLHLHRQHTLGPVDPRVFGGFLEHMGRAVYEGVYAPESKHADADGCRKDVLGALQPLQMTAMRYPGGNFASGYHWQDGIGPRSQRPKMREFAWQSLEPNQFGTDEYIRLCRKMNWTPMLTVNLGTGSPEEARNWVEYSNAPAGTKYADMRAANGSREPHAVKLWCLGNEMDGAWQLGHVPANQYAIRAQQAAKMMKDTDKSIELVACGSCGTGMPTYMEWDREVLEYVGDFADYISLHRYVGNPKDDTPDFLAVTNSIDRQIEEMDAACRFVQARRKSKKRAYLCFDEWNVWYKNQEMNGAGAFAPHLVEEVYNLEDALVVAGFLQSFIRHADCVKIANLAQIVNVIAPILTRGDEMLLQSIYYPFVMITKRRDGVSLRPAVTGPSYESKNYGSANYVDASAILGARRLHVFLANRHGSEHTKVKIEAADLGITGVESAEILSGPGAKAANSYEKPDLVTAKQMTSVETSGGHATVSLPPLSFAAVTFTLA
ncbi:MAG: alpha-N-arabinofuranosidase [Planctomycetes bacterium]|nr:alpha-N-arabinofuranosidase [Planctomycetota bacterium]